MRATLPRARIALTRRIAEQCGPATRSRTTASASKRPRRVRTAGRPASRGWLEETVGQGRLRGPAASCSIVQRMTVGEPHAAARAPPGASSRVSTSRAGEAPASMRRVRRWDASRSTSSTRGFGCAPRASTHQSPPPVEQVVGTERRRTGPVGDLVPGETGGLQDLLALVAVGQHVVVLATRSPRRIRAASRVPSSTIRAYALTWSGPAARAAASEAGQSCSVSPGVHRRSGLG